MEYVIKINVNDARESLARKVILLADHAIPSESAL